MTTMHEQKTEGAIRAVAERIHSGSRFLITGHRNPDGDAIGSALALQGLLRKMGKDARVVVRDPFHRSLHHLPGADDVVIAETLPEYPGTWDALFTMECPEPERTGYAILPGPVVNIDHHLGNTMYGEVNYVDLDAPSVGEMILQLNEHELRQPLDPAIAAAMYVSLASDTGFFRYSNTTIRTFRAAETMVDAGADPGEISLWLNESSSLGSIRLLGLCLNTLRISEDGTIATLELARAMFKEAGADPEDSEGLVNWGRSIDGVRVAALFKEANGGTRVSMRAKPGVDVQAVAATFGGGGHKAASGCFVPLPMDAAREKIVGLLREAVQKGATDGGA